MSSTKLFAVVAGAGPGTGKATALRFSKAYPVVLIARRPESYEEAVAEIKAAGGTAVGVSADASDAASLDAAFERIKTEVYPGHKLAVAVYNAAGGFMQKPFLETSVEELAGSLDGSVKGFFNFAQKTLPLLLETVETSPPHPPTLLVTGATASVRGSANFSTFAAAMFGRRGLAQSLAREFGPKGVHVAHAVIDGVIDIPRTKAYANVNGGVEDGKIRADAIAESYWHLHAQHRSAFTQEIDVRPFVEKF
ncbi:putative short chain dehydrogenase protein [Eutypa lata UCREL1]|uniref:Putative short chain dehydrogenase protein n=1 Tax=Eutypa lata (strain UCR-EL1) TaxID=1287681 RepID=M7SB32_EUTLA|nr:putative short chain dehydrogenase protein [Eutypa lata UCREL1]